MDIPWLINHGWTVPGNLAYRRILHEFNKTRVLQSERIEQILMQYELGSDQIAKIQQSLQELIALKQELEND